MLLTLIIFILRSHITIKHNHSFINYYLKKFTINKLSLFLKQSILNQFIVSIKLRTLFEYVRNLFEINFALIGIEIIRIANGNPRCSIGVTQWSLSSDRACTLDRGSHALASRSSKITLPSVCTSVCLPAPFESWFPSVTRLWLSCKIPSGKQWDELLLARSGNFPVLARRETLGWVYHSF